MFQNPSNLSSPELSHVGLEVLEGAGWELVCGVESNAKIDDASPVVVHDPHIEWICSEWLLESVDANLSVVKVRSHLKRPLRCATFILWMTLENEGNGVRERSTH